MHVCFSCAVGTLIGRFVVRVVVRAFLRGMGFDLFVAGAGAHEQQWQIFPVTRNLTILFGKIDELGAGLLDFTHVDGIEQHKVVALV